MIAAYDVVLLKRLSFQHRAINVFGKVGLSGAFNATLKALMSLLINLEVQGVNTLHLANSARENRINFSGDIAKMK